MHREAQLELSEELLIDLLCLFNPRRSLPSIQDHADALSQALQEGDVLATQEVWRWISQVDEPHDLPSVLQGYQAEGLKAFHRTLLSHGAEGRQMRGGHELRDGGGKEAPPLCEAAQLG